MYSEEELRHTIAIPKLFSHPMPAELAGHFDSYEKANGEKKRKEIRDTAQNLMLLRSEQICTHYQTRLVYNIVVGNAGLSVGQSLAKAVFAPAAAAESVFSTTSATVVGSLSKEVLQHEVFKATTRNIQVSRAKTLTEIQSRQRLSTAEYSLSRAMFEAEYYHNLCNFTIQYVAGESSSAPPKTEQAKDEAKPKPTSAPASTPKQTTPTATTPANR